MIEQAIERFAQALVAFEDAGYPQGAEHPAFVELRDAQHALSLAFPYGERDENDSAYHAAVYEAYRKARWHERT